MPDKQENKILSNQEDIEIIKTILTGDKNSFSKLQKKYYRTVFSVIRRMIRNEDDAEDLTQETFIKAYNALASFDVKYFFSSWLMKIASNNCIDYMRKRKLETISYSQNISNNDDDDLFLQIPSLEILPDEKYSENEKLKILLETIDSLPENFRKMILLRFQKELDYSEIAAELNIPLGTVKASLFRAKKMLQILLKRHQNLFDNI
jgi:RNA polymerase sigma-70 factor (ECF subfamily)